MKTINLNQQFSKDSNTRKIKIHTLQDSITKNPESYQSRKKLITYWIATAILAFTMFSGAVGEILHQWGTLETHTILGYPIYLLSIIGTWKILGTITIIVPKFPRLKEWGLCRHVFQYDWSICFTCNCRRLWCGCLPPYHNSIYSLYRVNFMGA